MPEPTIATRPFVFMIESPTPEEILHGTYEGHGLLGALSLSHIRTRYHLAVNKEMFLRAIGTVLPEAITAENAYSILHLSLHANTNGVQLTDTQFVTWPELGQHLTPINKRLHGMLIVCISACQGFSGVSMAFSDQTPPFMYLVGPQQDILYPDALAAFVTFYTRLFAGDSTDDLSAAMNAAAGRNIFQIMTGATAQGGYLKFVAQTPPQMGQS